MNETAAARLQSGEAEPYAFGTMKRDTAQTIFRTVVIAGAMLGSGAGCGKKAANTTPTPINTEAADPTTADPTAVDPANATPDPCAGAGADPCASADPCAGGERPRGTDDDGGGGAGRGFVLS